MSEAVFWNPSSIANSRKPYNISLLTNVKNNVKLGGFYRVNKKLTLGGGIIYTMQDEFRRAHFDQGGAPRDEDSVSMKLKEYAAVISPVYKVNNNLSVALTIKSLWQDFNIPNTVFVNPDRKSIFTDKSIKKQHFDVDVSATYKISSALQAGINLMNLAGTELYADAFVPNQANIPMQKQRSLGFGLLYKWQRLNVGSDILFTEDGFYDATFGVNYVPFNNALLSAGIAVQQLSYSFAFRIKHFRIAYINDNDWLINEKRKGKSAILNGKIYGGFIFDLN
jgi:long-subunit fatty acid transport protein